MFPRSFNGRRSFPAALAMLALAACGGGSSGGAASPPLPPPPPPPPPPPAGLVDVERVFDQVTMNSPLAAYQVPGDDTRWYVVERAGRIRTFPNDPSSTDGDVATFIDISARVSAQGEGGLLDAAFHPSWGINNNYEVFVSYTRTSGGGLESVISRFRSQDGGATLDASMEDIIMTVVQDQDNHNGGQIAFGPDGYLYAGWGDGGGGNDPNNRGQDTTNLLGTFTRVDVDGAAPYAIPPDNPFSANAASPCVQGFGGADCPEIFAWGLRNPWRWSFDPVTGELWAGDVGQGAWEEINRIENGVNYGWSIREGGHCRPPTTGCQSMGMRDPVTEYGRQVGTSITGGYVYRGANVSNLQGMYVYGDFGSGRIFAIPADSTPGTPTAEVSDTSLGIVSFAVDNDGELYILSLAGTMHRLIDAP